MVVVLKGIVQGVVGAVCVVVVLAVCSVQGVMGPVYFVIVV